MLKFLCDSALDHPDEPLSEQRIGTAVFGRERGYDTAVDTIARVQVSQLRKKLKEYYSSEGSHERLIIDIPLGSYVPTFSRRDSLATPPVASVIGLPAEHHRESTNFWKYCAAILLVTTFTLAASLAVIKHDANTRTVSGGPRLDTFWKPFLAGTRDLPVVVSDANLMIVSRMLGRVVTLHEYRDPNYPESLIEQFSDAKTREAAKTILGNYYTGTQDTRVVNVLASLVEQYQTRIVVVPAREFRLIPGAAGNVVLIGHNHGNPWFELFDSRMNFHYVWAKGADSPVIANRRPRAGEQSEYGVVFQRSGFCVVAYEPTPDGHGNALLIIGT
ncbi:MAG: winged helix-turn-helix domain-containing protein, partial [Acidobacteriaceae bacterium]|nr:winged helix-turn-helix domain-containing protein [Acidobacteriaceae bacterium]